MFCAAIPTVAATGVALDSKHRKDAEKNGKAMPRIRPFPLLTAGAILLLMLGSVFFHTKFPRLG
jgi:hypothetical protein